MIKVSVNNATQHSVHRSPAKSAGAMVVGLQPVGTACAFSGGLRGLMLVPPKRRCLVPPTSE